MISLPLYYNLSSMCRHKLGRSAFGPYFVFGRSPAFRVHCHIIIQILQTIRNMENVCSAVLI